jgi:hypothetical protein
MPPPKDPKKKEEWIRNRTGTNNPFFGKHHSVETKEKNRDCHIGHKVPVETRKKISISMMGKKNHMFGKTHSSSTRREISIAQTGERNTNFGKTGEKSHMFGRVGSKAHNWRGGISRKPDCVDCGNPVQLCGGKRCRSCYVLFSQGENHSGWKGGLSFLPYSPKFNGSLKSQIRERDGYICMKCGKFPSNCVHHIDYDKNNCCFFNLLTLCRSCNGQVNTKREMYQAVFTIMQEQRGIPR